MKIVDYRILYASRNNTLEEAVSLHIPEWQPLGQPYLDKNGLEKQAMVIYEEAKPKAKKKSSEDNKNGAL